MQDRTSWIDHVPSAVGLAPGLAETHGRKPDPAQGAAPVGGPVAGAG